MKKPSLELKEMEHNGIRIVHCLYPFCKGCMIYDPVMNHDSNLFYSDNNVHEAHHCVEIRCQHEQSCYDLVTRLLRADFEKEVSES